MSSIPSDSAQQSHIDKLFWGIITASHILHHHGILDAYSQLSVRNPDQPSNFFMPCNVPPALLSSSSHIIEYSVEDAIPVHENAKPGFVERFIHSEIYKAYPSVHSIVHSHCLDVLPFTINNVPFKAAIHTSGFLGSKPIPVWDSSITYDVSSSKTQDTLVRTKFQGHSLAHAFHRPDTDKDILKEAVSHALPHKLAESVKPHKTTNPDYTTVLMRGHGFVTIADSFGTAVYQAIYTKEAAKVLSTSLTALNAHTTSKLKDAVIQREKEIQYLSTKEAKDAANFTQETIMRPWALWVREVQVNPLYVCDITLSSNT